MAIAKRNNTYYAYYRRAGRIVWVGIGDDLETAKAIHDRIMAENKKERTLTRLAKRHPQAAADIRAAIGKPKPSPLDNLHHVRSGLRLDQMLEVAKRKRNLNPRTCRYFSTFAAKINLKYADQVTPKVALDYLEANYSNGNGKTYNNVKSMLNTVFRCCLVEAGMDNSPFAAVINRRVETVEKHRNLTLAEFDTVCQHLPLNLLILATLSRWTCQRLETCARITPEMFDFDRRVFTIEPGKTKRFGKWVCVPILPPLESFIKPLLPKCKPNLPIVANFSTPKANNHYYSKHFNAILRQCGIKDDETGKASFHSIRGTAITWYKEHGVKGEDLRSITGHATDAVEDIYARDIASLQRIAAALQKV